jgi:hypothetical protein
MAIGSQDPQEGAPRRKSTPLAILLGVLLTAVVAFGFGLVIAANNDSHPMTASAQLNSLENACDSWRGSLDVSGPDETWCRGMVDVMRNYDRDGMMGGWMWNVPDDVRSGCRQWLDDDRRVDPELGSRWCDDMVDWMRTHMDVTERGWMMRDR